jgi:hypothetical protein
VYSTGSLWFNNDFLKEVSPSLSLHFPYSLNKIWPIAQVLLKQELCECHYVPELLQPSLPPRAIGKVRCPGKSGCTPSGTLFAHGYSLRAQKCPQVGRSSRPPPVEWTLHGQAGRTLTFPSFCLSSAHTKSKVCKVVEPGIKKCVLGRQCIVFESQGYHLLISVGK